MNKSLAILALTATMMIPHSVLAAGDAAAGKDKSMPCQACHGENGLATDPMYPNLAGQYESYLSTSLKAYRDGGRTNPVMAGFATNLSDDDVEDLAAWFASQPGLKVVIQR